MKKILALILALCMVFAIAACGEKTDGKTDGQTDGKTDGNTTEATGSVYWLNFKPESDADLQKLAAMYTEKTGVKVNVVTAASGTYSQTLTAEMDKSNPPTIFIVGNQEGVKTWKDYCLDLKGTKIANELNTSAYNLYDETGKLCSIGYCYECYGIIVNVDLLEQAGHSLSEITNFATLKTVVEDIHARASELGFDAFTSSDMDPSSSWRFTGHMINLEYVYEERAAGTVWTSCPATLTGAYMDNFKNLYDLAINNSEFDPATFAAGGHDAEGEFTAGKAVFFVNGSWEYQAVSEGKNVAMIPYYCGVAGEEKAGLNCGTQNCWAVNAKASEADQKATLDFLYWCVTDAEASRLLVDSFGVMPYTHAAESTNGFLANANEYSNNGCYVMDWATNYQPNVDEYRATFVSALNAYNADQSAANWDQVVKAAIDGWAYQYTQVNG